jgi:hypothetical protein
MGSGSIELGWEMRYYLIIYPTYKFFIKGKKKEILSVFDDFENMIEIKYTKGYTSFKPTYYTLEEAIEVFYDR